jgi:protein-tyrosine phosphatase
MDSRLVKVLFVCLGNICRSPTAEGVFRALVEKEKLSGRVEIDSAGTAAYHVGEPPDPRACAAAKKRGIDLSTLRGRQAKTEDFHRFDYVLAMDRQNHATLSRICPAGAEDRLKLFLEFGSQTRVKDVPDPYYGGSDGFETVLDLIEDASRGLLDHIRRNHLSTSHSSPGAH